jgi:hypothetical protein
MLLLNIWHYSWILFVDIEQHEQTKTNYNTNFEQEEQTKIIYDTKYRTAATNKIQL